MRFIFFRKDNVTIKLFVIARTPANLNVPEISDTNKMIRPAASLPSFGGQVGLVVLEIRHRNRRT